MDTIIVVTDGSFLKKYKIAGYGIYFPNKELPNSACQFKLKPFTNQRAELYAIYSAIKRILKNLPKIKRIIIYSDSMYSINTISKWMFDWEKNNWKGIKNLDIIRDKIYPLVTKSKKNFVLRHIESHTGKTDFLSLWNCIVDEYAKIGALKGLKKDLTFDLKKIEKEILSKCDV